MKIYQNIFLPGMNCQGDCDCQEEYKSGYTAGYQSGYTDGYDAECSGCSGCSQEELDEAYDEGYESGSTDGYASGYTNGYESGYTDGAESVDCSDFYNSGYTDGYDSGLTDGFADGYESGATDTWQPAYNSGYTDGIEAAGGDYASGYTDGYNVGYESGFTDGVESVDCTDFFNSGYTSGLTDGYNSGYTAGSEQTYPIAFNEGYESGYTDGYAIGEGEGFNDGYLSGSTDGFNTGYNSGLTDGFENGYDSGSTDGYASGTTAGFNSGYTSGRTDGIAEQKEKLASTAFTLNGIYTRADGWSSVTVNVAQTGYTQQDLDNAYASGLTNGYDSGYTIGYESGFTDGCYECGDDYSKDYLTFEALSGGTLYWHTSSLSNPKTIEWSNDSGETWNQVTSNNTGSGSVITTVNAGDKVMFRANWNNSGAAQSHFLTDCPFNAYGNVMSLIDSTNYRSLDTLSSNETFKSLFLNCTNLISAENLILPATSLTYNCYAGMFQNCSSLIAAPELPAETLSAGCYASMFYRCSSLETAPELPAEILYQNSYANMFSYCSNLNYIKCLATDISAIDSTHNWVDGVASAGTFVRSVDMNDWTIGKDGIPTDWVIMPPVPVSSSGLVVTYLSTGQRNIKLFNSVSGFSAAQFEDGTPITLTQNSQRITVDSANTLYTVIYTLSNSVSAGSDDTFWTCGEVVKVEVPEGVTTIPKLFLYGASKLSAVTLPNSLQEIKESAFDNFGEMSAITIPSGVTYLGRSALYGSHAQSAETAGFREIILLPTIPPTLSGTADYASPFNLISNGIIYVPDASVNTYKTTPGYTLVAARIKGISERPNN